MAPWPFWLLVAVLFIGTTISIDYLYLRHSRHVPRPLLHMTERWRWLRHIPLPLVWLLVAVNLSVGAVAVRHLYGGALYNPRLHIKPSAALLAGGGGIDSVDYLWAVQAGRDQGSSEACGAYVATTIYAAELVRRGYRPQCFSAEYTFGHATGGIDRPTTWDEEAHALIDYGVVPCTAQTYVGYPAAWETNSAVGRGGQYGYAYYNQGGYGAVLAGVGALRTYGPVGVLLRVNDDLYRAFGQPQADDYGYTHFSHWATLAGAFRDASGQWVFRVVSSWGQGWGQGGVVSLVPQATFESNVLAIGWYTPSYAAWPVLTAPKPLPPVRPTTTPNPRPVPTRAPVAPHTPAHRATRPTLTPVRHVLYTLRATHALRNAPFAGSRHLATMLKGWQVRGTGQRQGAWIRVIDLTHRHVGWSAVSWLRP